MCEICSKLTIKTPERSVGIAVNFEQILHIAPVFLSLTLDKKNASWVYSSKKLLLG